VTPAQLADLVRAAARDVLRERGLDVAALPDDVGVTRRHGCGYGDYATSVALRTAGRAGRAPEELAGWLAEVLVTRPGVASAQAAGRGFVNLRLVTHVQGALVGQVLAAGAAYGTGDELAGREVGPALVGPGRTGPLPLGLARRAVVGDALGRVLAARGARPAHRPGAAPEDPVDAGSGAGPTVRVVCDGGPVDGRTDPVVTMDDLVAAVGADAARYALVRRPLGVALELDLGLLARRTEDNPVFGVQFAHAHLAATARHAAEVGLAPGDEYGLLDHPGEGELLGALGEFPAVLRTAAQRREPHRVARHLESLAGGCHRFHGACRVLPMGDEEITDVHRARLSLCLAARQVLATGLGLLAVTAPERM